MQDVGDAASPALALTATGALAADGRTYEAVTPAIFDCVKATSSAEHGTVYESTDGLSGTAVTSLPAPAQMMSLPPLP